VVRSLERVCVFVLLLLLLLLNEKKEKKREGKNKEKEILNKKRKGILNLTRSCCLSK
jgi:hypothetical protein